MNRLGKLLILFLIFLFVGVSFSSCGVGSGTIELTPTKTINDSGKKKGEVDGKQDERNEQNEQESIDDIIVGNDEDCDNDNEADEINGPDDEGDQDDESDETDSDYESDNQESEQDPEPQEPVKSNQTITFEMNGWVYNQMSGTPTINGAHESPDIIYEYSQTANFNVIIEPPINAGTYYVRAHLSSTEHYNEYMTEEIQFTIAKAEQNVSAVITEENELNIIGIQEYAEIEYYEYSNDDIFATIITKPITPGIYYVRAVLSATINYNTYTTAAVEFVIPEPIYELGSRENPYDLLRGEIIISGLTYFKLPDGIASATYYIGSWSGAYLTITIYHADNTQIKVSSSSDGYCTVILSEGEYIEIDYDYMLIIE
jgi:hypothetical protein